MSVNPEPLEGEILDAELEDPRDEAFECEACFREMNDEPCYITEDGSLICQPCFEMGGHAI